jgi:hypothetical protein
MINVHCLAYLRPLRVLKDLVYCAREASWQMEVPRFEAGSELDCPAIVTLCRTPQRTGVGGGHGQINCSRVPRGADRPRARRSGRSNLASQVAAASTPLIKHHKVGISA